MCRFSKGFDLGRDLPTPVPSQGSAKAFGRQLKENPAPPRLPGKIQFPRFPLKKRTTFSIWILQVSYLLNLEKKNDPQEVVYSNS